MGRRVAVTAVVASNSTPYLLPFRFGWASGITAFAFSASWFLLPDRSRQEQARALHCIQDSHSMVKYQPVVPENSAQSEPFCGSLS